ncbi:MAG: MFS transporter, partial [Desulfuromonadales bacterium]|nr:MFS transporter [Desulfuromonadales bacterium]
LGLSALAAALAGFAVHHPEGLFAVMFLFCAAMFLVHATASGVLNRHAGQRKGIVNGLYIAFYYGGGTVGSWLPGFVYRGYGWGAFLTVLGVVTVAAWLLVFGCRRFAQAAQE